MSSNVNVQAVPVQSVTDQTNNFYLVGEQLQLKPANQNSYSAVNHSRVSEAQNRTDGRFIASFVNQGNQSVTINFFNVFFFNETTKNVPAITLTDIFNTNDPSMISVPVNGSYTEVFDQSIPFKRLDVLYEVQYQFQYSFGTTTGGIVATNSTYNFTLHSQLPLYTPPEFIIWTWWTLNVVIAVHVLVGWYGNRKMRKLEAAKE